MLHFLKLFCFIIILFCFSNQSAYAQVRKIHLDDNAENHINKISFYSKSEGFIAFTNWIGYTSDSGRTFAKKTIYTGNVDFGSYNVTPQLSFAIKGIKAFNKNTLLVYGEWDLVPAILYSTNGGTSFKLVFYSIYDFHNYDYRLSVLDMVFPGNSNIGYAIDYDRILKTTDGGQSWSINKLQPDNFFTKLTAVDDNHVFAFQVITDTVKVLKTSDGVNWNSWVPVTTPAVSIRKILDISFANSSKGWMTLQDNAAKGRLFKTIDGGNSWVEQGAANDFYLTAYKMQFANDSVGYVLSGQNTVYKTKDRGSYWERLGRDNSYAYLNYSHNDLQVISADQFWAGGGHGFLELSTNGGGNPFPKGSFRIDTTNLYLTGLVNVINSSNPANFSMWYKNRYFFTAGYNFSYQPDYSHPVDTITLISSNSMYSDTSRQIIRLVNPTPQPVITNFSPTSAGTNSTIKIKGSGLLTTTAVLFGQTSAIKFVVESDSVIIATVGGGSSGSITVTNLYGTTDQTGFAFEYGLLPVITSFSPLSGYTGSLITIKGTNFGPAAADNIVYFGAAKGKIISASSSELIVEVPTGATFKSISVLNTLSSLTGYSRNPFIITFPGGNSDVVSMKSFSLLSHDGIAESTLCLICADFDNDGKPDLASDTYRWKLNFLRNNSVPGVISFTKVNEYVLGNLLKAGTSDIDGDGKLDIVVLRDTASYSMITILKNVSSAGNILFEVQKDIKGEFNEIGFAIGDLDKDGKPDIVSIDFSQSRFFVFRNTSVPGNISFASKQAYSLGNHPYGVTIDDIDGDTKPELLIAYLTETPEVDSNLLIYRNLSTPGNISLVLDKKLKTNISYPTQIKVTDFNNDQKPDILVTQDGSKVYVWKNKSIPGSITLDDRLFFKPIYNYSDNGSDEVADMNGDGKPDFVAFASGSFTNTSDSNISFSFPEKPEQWLNKSSECLADYDADGKVDIAVVNYSSIQMYRNIIANNFLCPGTDSKTSFTSNVDGVAYQWQESLDGITFNNISNTANFSGTNSKTITIINLTTSFNKRLYRCIADGKVSEIFSIHITNAWEGGEGNWDDTGTGVVQECLIKILMWLL